MARLASLDDLRRVLPEPRPTTRAKILDALDEQSIEFLGRCPFALVGTTAADGTIEVSPKGDDPGFTRGRQSLSRSAEGHRAHRPGLVGCQCDFRAAESVPDAQG